MSCTFLLTIVFKGEQSFQNKVLRKGLKNVVLLVRMCQISKTATKYCSNMLKIHLEKVNGGSHCGAYFFGFRQLLIICDVCYATATDMFI